MIAMDKMSLLETGGAILALLLVMGLFLVGCEKKLIFHPQKYPEGVWDTSNFGFPVEDVYFKSADGVWLHGWYVPASQPEGTLLWFHGNAGNLTHRWGNIAQLRFLNLNVFIFDYRGYGRSEGQPSEAGIYRDAEAAYLTLMQKKEVSPERLILFGRSLGAAPATHVALKHPAAGLILESAFTSARDMADALFPVLPVGFLIRSDMNVLERVAQIKIPKLILHGNKDEVVPYALGKKLFQAAAEPKTFYEIENAGHNDTYLAGGQSYYAAWENFVRQVTLPGK